MGGRVVNAGVSNQNYPLGDLVPSRSVPGAPVDGMLVVEATATRVELK